MPFLSGLIGGAIGFGMQLSVNAARKIPLSRGKQEAAHNRR